MDQNSEWSTSNSQNKPAQAKITINTISQIKEGLEKGNHDLINEISNIGPDFKKLVDSFSQDFHTKMKAKKSVQVVSNVSNAVTEKTVTSQNQMLDSKPLLEENTLKNGNKPSLPVSHKEVNESSGESTIEQRFLNAKRAAEEMVKLAGIKFNKQSDVKKKDINWRENKSNDVVDLKKEQDKNLPVQQGQYLNTENKVKADEEQMAETLKAISSLNESMSNVNDNIIHSHEDTFVNKQMDSHHDESSINGVHNPANDKVTISSDIKSKTTEVDREKVKTDENESSNITIESNSKEIEEFKQPTEKVTSTKEAHDVREISVDKKTEDSDESIPSDYTDDEDLEIIGEKPAYSVDNDETESLVEDRPPSDDDDDDVDDDDDDSFDEEDMAEEVIDSSDKEENVSSESDDEVKINETDKCTGEEVEKDRCSGEEVENMLTDVTDIDKTKPKPKRTRKRKKKDSSDDKDPKKRKKSFERRNIRKIRKETQLDEETLKAQNEELERKKRLLEKIERLKQSHLQSLLEDDDEDDDDDEGGKTIKRSIPTPVFDVKKSEAEVIDISSDDDEITLIPNEQTIEDEEHDPNNSGSHVNDAMNQPDSNGQVLVNVGHPPDEPDIFLVPQLGANVKPHQIGGIRFLYDNLVESLQQYKSSNGLGCILAHSMGLGKTLQVISFTDVFLRYTEGTKVLIIVPVNTLQNWISEYNMWLPAKNAENKEQRSNIWPREFTLFVVNDSHKTTASRSKVVEDWYKTGGCLLMGYEMYRLLTSKKVGSRAKKTKNNEPVMIDLVEEERNTELLFGLKSALVNPGPDLIICDEGHRIKNNLAGISQALKNIRTRRRVVLTGYPLQNNLLEYWCMVDFTRPNFLGSRTEFANMFERPIMNGQCIDSTPQDHRLMRFRAHVLHSLLEGFVQRRSHDVLRRSLPMKEEHVLFIRMSNIQRILYKAFMDDLQNPDMTGWANTNPLKAFSVCCKIWNHPDILNQIVEQRKLEDNDLDIEDAKVDELSGKKKGGRGRGSNTDLKKVGSSSSMFQEGGFSPFERQSAVSYDWAIELLNDYKTGVVQNSGKLVVLLSILEQAINVGDKILVFSQSLYTLSLIEEYLSKLKIPNQNECWAKNKSYFRLDGSTAGQDREKMINQFNHPENNKIHLFLLSTRAGCLGINLIGANRVVVFDASWNPCHDAQAVCRVYRYGQQKKCYVYRLVSDLTMEKKIYDRQINKQGMSDRVVDELNPINSLTRKQVDVLLQYEDIDLPMINPDSADNATYEDPVLYGVVKQYHKWITKDPFTHESLLIDRKDQKLTQMEKRLARQGYEMEKKMNISYSRPSYAAFYPKAAPTQSPAGMPIIPHPMDLPRLPTYRNRPVASVRPMMSRPPIMTTPIPLQPLSAIQQLHENKTAQSAIDSSDSSHSGAVTDSPKSTKMSTGPAILKPGVSVQQVKLQSDIPVPGSSTPSGGPQRIPAGETVLVIKTPKGVYIRTPQGKIFAVRSAPKGKEEDSTAEVINRSMAEANSNQNDSQFPSEDSSLFDQAASTQRSSDLKSVNLFADSTNVPNNLKIIPNKSESSLELQGTSNVLKDNNEQHPQTYYSQESTNSNDIHMSSSKLDTKDLFDYTGGNSLYKNLPSGLHQSSGANAFPFYAPGFSGPSAYQPWSQSNNTNPYLNSAYQYPGGHMTGSGWDMNQHSVPPLSHPLSSVGGISQQTAPHGGDMLNPASWSRDYPMYPVTTDSYSNVTSSESQNGQNSHSGLGLSQRYEEGDSLDTLVKDLGIEQSEDSNASIKSENNVN